MGAKVEVNTNGLLITEKNVTQLRDAGCSLLKISLDTPMKQEYKAIREIDAFEKIIKGIEIANQIMPVRVNCVVLRSYLHTIYPLIELMSEIGVPRIHLLDLTYYPSRGSRNFWQKEFVYLTKEILPLIEKKTGGKFSKLPIFGCSFYALSTKKTTIVLKEANPTMRSPLYCSQCRNYCHEGMFTLRLSAAGYLNNLSNR
jgi:molybdenum cofactor biosynthesis enzyme MoaA